MSTSVPRISAVWYARSCTGIACTMGESAPAWREKTWPSGDYSIVTFALSDFGTGTKLTFDHAGFPRGAGHHLSIGWYENYWDPLRKYLT